MAVSPFLKHTPRELHWFLLVKDWEKFWQVTEHGIFQSCFIEAVSVKIPNFSLKIIESQILYYQICVSLAAISCSEITITLEKQYFRSSPLILELLFIVWKWINCYENAQVKLTVERYFSLCKPVIHCLENTLAEIIRSRVWFKTKPWNIDQKSYNLEYVVKEYFLLNSMNSAWGLSQHQVGYQCVLLRDKIQWCLKRHLCVH